MSDAPKRERGSGRRRLVLVNQFLPPALPPTARLLGELAEKAERDGWETVLIGRREGYGSKTPGGLRRYLRDLWAHARIAFRLFMVRRPSLVVCLSDPPCLPVTVAAIAWLRRVDVIHWAMDVYPETALALGQLRPGMISRGLARAMGWAYRRCKLVVALDEDMAEKIRRAVSGNVALEVQPPWPPATPPQANPVADPPVPKDQRIWLYSGNLGRAHEWRTLIDAQYRLEQAAAVAGVTPAWRLVLQGGGAAMQQARLESERIGLAHVEFRPYASEDRLLESLLAADALIATLRPGLQGLLWPSKLALMSQCRLPIAWVGPIDGAVVRFLQDHAQTGVFRPGDAESLVDWLMGLSSHQDPAQPSEVTVQVMRIREQGLHSWQGWLAQA